VVCGSADVAGSRFGGLYALSRHVAAASAIETPARRVGRMQSKQARGVGRCSRDRGIRFVEVANGAV